MCRLYADNMAMMTSFSIAIFPDREAKTRTFICSRDENSVPPLTSPLSEILTERNYEVIYNTYVACFCFLSFSVSQHHRPTDHFAKVLDVWTYPAAMIVLLFCRFAFQCRCMKADHTTLICISVTPSDGVPTCHTPRCYKTNVSMAVAASHVTCTHPDCWRRCDRCGAGLLAQVL